MNITIIKGNLCRDPETRFTPKGTAVVNLSVAVNEKRTVNGEVHEKTAFIDCTAFGKTGEAIAKYLTKGRGILVQGKLETQQWQDKQTGAKRSKTIVVVDNFEFVDRQVGAGEQASDAPAPRQAAVEHAAGKPEPEEDDVPF